MYARSTTIHGKPDNIDDGIRFIDGEVRQALDAMDGCRGLSLLVDRESGLCIATSSWDSEESMRASDTQVKSIRERGSEIFGGDMEVDEWEIAVMHRSAHGECCRVTWAKGDIDRGIDSYRMGVLPEAEQMRGFCSASLLVNRSTGMACATTTWESRGAMEASRAKAEELRAKSAADADLEIVDVHGFDLAYAHLHVPEMA